MTHKVCFVSVCSQHIDTVCHICVLPDIGRYYEDDTLAHSHSLSLSSDPTPSASALEKNAVSGHLFTYFALSGTLQSRPSSAVVLSVFLLLSLLYGYCFARAAAGATAGGALCVILRQFMSLLNS